MGHSSSKEEEHYSQEKIAAELAERFARRCFELLELYSFKDTFRSLADETDGVLHLREDTIARFLELPDIIGASPIIFQMLSYIGAFPFLSEAPVVLGFDQMICVVAIMTERYTRILAKGAATRRKLLFKSLAVYDRKLSEVKTDQPASNAESGLAENGDAKSGNRSHAPGFSVDVAGDDADDEGVEEDDELVLAALESLNLNDAFKVGGQSTTYGAMIPSDNFRRLIMLLLLIAPLDVQENISSHGDRIAGEELDRSRATADCILSTFLNVEQSPGITLKQFNRILPLNFPYLFVGFNALFEKFLFSKNLDFSKRKGGEPAAVAPVAPPKPPLVPTQDGILTLNLLSQLSFFIPGNELFHRLQPLYSGAEAGYSLGSFETKVFNWRAPTLLLISGTRLESSATRGPEETFTSTLPPKRFPDGNASCVDGSGDRLIYGVLIRQPWKQTFKECFGDSDILLFQLAPTHDVFPASLLNKSYASFNKPPAPFPGVTFGCSPSASSTTRHAPTIRPLGPVSLVLDSSFEYGVFTHDATSGGGAFNTSASRRFDFQDRFSVDEVEVWGLGGDEEMREQAERWKWEQREAEVRRRINLGTGDREADRMLLEMAGLVGQNRSGGSMV